MPNEVQKTGFSMTEGALIRRINRRLPEYHKLHKARPREQHDLGSYYVVDHYRNSIVAHHIDDLAAEFPEAIN
jgi:hypothetical protein